MFPRLSLSIPILALVTLLAGCVTDDVLPQDQVYQAPAARAGEVAYLKGTYSEDPGLFAAKHTGYVLMVDRKFVQNAEENWNTPLALSPGLHEVSVEYRQSVFKGRTLFKLLAEPGVTYELRIVPGTKEESDERFCEFTIVNAATGKPVLPTRRAHVSGSANRSNFRPLD